MTTEQDQIWDLWIPDAASRGISFARGVLAATESLWVHSAPPKLRVEVRTPSGSPIAEGDNLEGPTDMPMTLLHLSGDSVRRENRWPGSEDVGSLVILPGGEVGELKSWWNAGDHNEWRWTVEFHNRR